MGLGQTRSSSSSSSRETRAEEGVNGLTGACWRGKDLLPAYSYDKHDFGI